MNDFDHPEADKRHAQGIHYSGDEIAALKPQEFKAVLHSAARFQRGAPEDHMNRMQFKYGGGVYTGALEHVGDLTHRIGERGGSFGTEFVKPKVESMLEYLTSGYGFEREMKENLISNRANRTRRGEIYPSDEEFMEDSKKYADLHRMVPAYTRPSMHGRAAAVALGEHDYGGAIRHLNALNSIIKQGPDHWKALMSQEGSVNFLRQMGK